MEEYIERNSFLKRLRGELVEKYPTTFYNGLSAAANELSKVPTADVAPIKRSFWVCVEKSAFGGYDKNGDVRYLKRNGFVCERCRTGTAVKFNYCPNCGAKMDGAE